MDEDDKKQEDGSEQLLGETHSSAKATEDKDETIELKKQLEEMETKSAEYLSGWQRAKADFSNYKKDENARLEDFAKYGNQEILKEFISVLDSFDLAVAALEKSGPVEKGVYMIRAQIEDLLKKRGLEKIDVKPDMDFDPNFAEAIAEAESEKTPGKIVDIIEQGYKLNGKVVRPARVVVSKIKNQ